MIGYIGKRGAFGGLPTFQLIQHELTKTFTGQQSGDICIWAGADWRGRSGGYESTYAQPSGFTALGTAIRDEYLLSNKAGNTYYTSQARFAYKVLTGGETSVDASHSKQALCVLRPRVPVTEAFVLVDNAFEDFNQSVDFTAEDPGIFPVYLGALCVAYNNKSVGSTTFDGVLARDLQANENKSAIAQISIPAADDDYSAPASISIVNSKGNYGTFDNMVLNIRTEQ